MKTRTASILLLCSICLCWGNRASALVERRPDQAEVEYLVRVCAGSGFDTAYLYRVFRDPGLRYIPGLVRRNVLTTEKKVYYDRFLDSDSLAAALAFARQWRTQLKQAEEAFDVDYEAVVAILLVETRLGKVLGRQPVLSVFASIVLENRDQHRRELSASMPDEALRKRYLDRLAQKGRWAREELLALLKLQQQHKSDIAALRGSYAGAFGMCQFLPSSYLRWAQDGDGSGTIDLFSMPDAIVSVCNYLKAHGWKRGLEHPSNHRVIRTYNNSKPYADAVLYIARYLGEAETGKDAVTDDE